MIYVWTFNKILNDLRQIGGFLRAHRHDIAEILLKYHKPITKILKYLFFICMISNKNINIKLKCTWHDTFLE
jgi:hypothetical protein